MRIAFFDHAFHAKTGSSSFFIRAMRTVGWRVELLSPEQAIDGRQTLQGFDAAVLWQQEQLAPLMSEFGIPHVICPMFDGVADVPNSYWDLVGDAPVLCFSLSLRQRLEALSKRTVGVRYFPEAQVNAPSRPANLRGFLWERQPGGWLDAPTVNHLFGARLSALHVHLASDAAASTSRRRLKEFYMPVTTSKWQSSARGYREALDESNVYFAPRVAEGIGLAFLEAMSKGICVVAADFPTHNEYIASGLTGYLMGLDYEGAPDLDPAEVREIGQNAWEFCHEGHQKWQSDDLPRALALIESVAQKRPESHALASEAVHIARFHLVSHSALVDYLEDGRAIAQLPLGTTGNVRMTKLNSRNGASLSGVPGVIELSPSGNVDVTIESGTESSWVSIGLESRSKDSSASAIWKRSQTIDQEWTLVGSVEAPDPDIHYPDLWVQAPKASFPSRFSLLNETSSAVTLRVVPQTNEDRLDGGSWARLLRQPGLKLVPSDIRPLVCQAWFEGELQLESEPNVAFRELPTDSGALLVSATNWCVRRLWTRAWDGPVDATVELTSAGWDSTQVNMQPPSILSSTAISLRLNSDLRLAEAYGDDPSSLLAWYYLHGVVEMNLSHVIPPQEIEWLISGSSTASGIQVARIDEFCSKWVGIHTENATNLVGWRTHPQLGWLQDLAAKYFPSWVVRH